MKKEIKKSEFSYWKIGFYGITIFIFLSIYLGPDILRYYKLQRERNMITLGGSKSDARESSLEYNKKINLFNQQLDSVIKTVKPLFVYTNDSAVSNGILYPNIKYNIFRRGALSRPLIQRNKEIIDEINYFTNNKDSLGYGIRIWLKNQRQYLNIAEINNLNEEQKFSVTTFYYYTDKEKENLRKHLNNSPKRNSSYNKTIEKQLQNLDKLQSSSVILTETELKNRRIKSGLRGLFAPKNKSIHANHKFYFTAYNRQLNIENFKVKVNQFVTMFLKDKNTTNCYYKELKLTDNY